MKLLFIFLSLLTTLEVVAQNVFVNRLEVSSIKTTSLIFPSKITSIDIGSQSVLAQRVQGTENVLQVKAGSQSFNETNLTVITEAGTLHQFDVRFCAEPKSCYFIIEDNGDVKSVRSIVFENAETKQFFDDAYRAIRSEANGRTRKTKSSKIELGIGNLFVKGNKLFLPISIINESFIPFQIESVRFFIKDRKQAKKTAVQEIELIPAKISDTVIVVNENGSANAIWVLDKFNLPKAKELIIQVSEKNGSRNIQLKIRSHVFQNARLLKS